MGKNILVTGATGFLGGALVERLLRGNDDTLHLLYRSDTGVRLMRERYGADVDRLEFVKGDIERPSLGLPKDYLTGKFKDISEFWHLAASTDFAETNREAVREANVEGTKRVLETIATYAPDLQRFFYTGTAYIAGKNRGTIPEGWFPKPKSFKNAYEETKKDAEEEVRKSGIPTTIIRPSIIIGDSRTGDAKGENRMYYGYALALLRGILHHPRFAQEQDRLGAFRDYWKQTGETGERLDVNARLFGDKKTTKNVVTLDYVVDAYDAIRKTPFIPGQTFNVVNKQNITMGESTDSIQKALRIQGLTFDPSIDDQKKLDPTNTVERVLHRTTRQFHDYMIQSEPTWQRRNVDALHLREVEMTPKLFDFMMEQFVKDEIINGKK